uniref:(California timema) hypothetical protein n=1 Tax=Timema californicum TaxID=61474 RepID=A0A7R9J185_TIMCA|nr:unnamed protein product [Timema californicum]
MRHGCEFSNMQECQLVVQENDPPVLIRGTAEEPPEYSTRQQILNTCCLIDMVCTYLRIKASVSNGYIRRMVLLKGTRSPVLDVLGLQLLSAIPTIVAGSTLNPLAGRCLTAASWQVKMGFPMLQISLQFEDRLGGLVVIGSGYAPRGLGFGYRHLQIIWEAVGLEPMFVAVFLSVVVACHARPEPPSIQYLPPYTTTSEDNFSPPPAAPADTYGPPSDMYGAPAGNYISPANTHATPSSTYGVPTFGASRSTSSYNSRSSIKSFSNLGAASRSYATPSRTYLTPNAQTDAIFSAPSSSPLTALPPPLTAPPPPFTVLLLPLTALPLPLTVLPLPLTALPLPLTVPPPPFTVLLLQLTALPPPLTASPATLDSTLLRTICR